MIKKNNKDPYSSFWKEIGKSDPYFGVLTHPEYLSDRMDQEAKTLFFESGRQHIERVMRVSQKIWPKKRPTIKSALDFGCGTGRLSLALAENCEQVLGVDISEAMIDEARINAELYQRDNVHFQVVSPEPPFLTESYHYIHSAMVFQHIPPEKGLAILDHLLSHLNPNGRAYFHILYHTAESPEEKTHRQRLFSDPRYAKEKGIAEKYLFPMFEYDMTEVFRIFQNHRVRDVYTTFMESGNHRFVNFYLKRWTPKS